MNIPPESVLFYPDLSGSTPPAPISPLQIPSLDEGDAPAPRAPLPAPSRETSRSAAAQMQWNGIPLRWTFGRLALWQALATASGHGTADSIRSLLDASIFLFLATHDESAWESAAPKSPPLLADHQRFLTAIRRWADEALPPSLEAGQEIISLFHQTLDLHNATRAVAVASEEDAAAAADPANP